MHIRILSILSLFIIFLACKKAEETGTEVNTGEHPEEKVTEKELSKIDYVDYALDIKTEDAVKDWKEYHQLHDVIMNLKKADLSFFSDNDEAINALLKEIKINIPASVKSPSILARIIALETKLRKLKSLYNLDTTSKEELKTTIKDFLVAFSSLNLQINKKVEFDSQDIEKP